MARLDRLASRATKAFALVFTFAVTQGPVPANPDHGPLPHLLRQAWRVVVPF
jgi:hypothetical protein